MDKKSKIFFALFGLLIVASVAVTFWRYMVKKDFVIENQVDCDPTTDKCFIWKCDPASDVDGEKCTGDADKDTWYYQIARRNASHIPLCDPDKDDSCKPMDCDPATEKDCSVTFCDDTNKKEQGVECNNPAQYNIDNPPAADSADSSDGATCAEGDTTCASQDTGADSSAPADAATPDSGTADTSTDSGN